jgi:anti-anti-sigma regulatory factor
MLRVSIIQEPGDTVTIRVEGRLSGRTVPELERAWHGLSTSLPGKILVLDLRGLTFADIHGQQVLAEIHRTAHPQFLADTPLTRYYAETAQQATATHSHDKN